MLMELVEERRPALFTKSKIIESTHKDQSKHRGCRTQ